ncbi:MAG: arsenate reductase ArsC [Pelolinea sp.]|nr:arsenate reductase ArsC [Pelolinea sp.]
MENHNSSDDRSQKPRSKKEVVFVCTGNSCRSQMAEAIINTRLGSEWKAYSAGTQPADRVHPYTIEVLKEIGIDHQGHTKTVDGFFGHDFDLVITVCDSAAEKCPLWLGKGKRMHMGFTDPTKARGDEATIMKAFRQVRDDIAEKIPTLLKICSS